VEKVPRPKEIVVIIPPKSVMATVAVPLAPPLAALHRTYSFITSSKEVTVLPVLVSVSAE